MSSPTGITMPALDVQEGSLFIVKKGTKVLGQVIRLQPTSQIQSSKIGRLGDTNKYTSYQPVEHSGTIEMYTDSDYEEVAALLGGTQKPTTGGWVGTEQLRLNPTIAAYDLSIEVYNQNTGSGDVLRGTHKLIGLKPTQVSPNIQSDSQANINFNFDCNDYYYQPAAAAGA